MRPVRSDRFEPLHSVQATRTIEAEASSALPEHTLMARAGLAVAQLARALCPHARCIWVACGPGNNGGDGLVAARHLHEWAAAHGGSVQVVVTHWTGVTPDEARLPADARHALHQARRAGVTLMQSPPDRFDLAIDALFGIGPCRPAQGALSDWQLRLRQSTAPVLCVDVPSGLDADTGAVADLSGSLTTLPPGATPGPRHTLSLLTLKPGLFTAHGRDLAGQVWLDDLGAGARAPTAWLAGRPAPAIARPHANHKGSHGDVAIIGGQDMAVTGVGMTGAAMLAARAALRGGAGRVYVGLLQPDVLAPAVTWDPVCPELMFRQPALLLDPSFLMSATVVCGCGGGSAVAPLLAPLLAQAPRLVLDADALNTVAGDPALQQALRARALKGHLTVMTPHPLEAARLLGRDTASVMADRLQAAQALSERYQVICVLKGSGSVMSAPGRIPFINPSGNATLATAGTGDVLAGWIGSAVATPGLAPDEAWARVGAAVHRHGWLADHWASTEPAPVLTAARLADRVTPLA